MKRTISILLSLALMLGILSACGQKAVEQEAPAEEPEVVIVAKDLVETVLSASGRAEALEVERLNADEDADRLGAYIEAVCGLASEQWEDAAVIRGMGASAFEIVVLRLGDEDAAGQVETVLTDYLTVREGAFTGYAPDEAEMASNGKVRRKGQYVGLFICPDPAGAEAMFAAAYKGEELPALPEPEPEPVEEAMAFTPVAPIEDILFRLVLDAAYPECVEHANVRDKDFVWNGYSYSPEVAFGISADQIVSHRLAEWHEIDPAYIATHGLNYGNRIIVFLAHSEEGASEMVKDLDTLRAKYLKEFQTAAEEGNTEAAEVVVVWENAQTVQVGRYAALIACDNTEDTVLLFPRIVNDPSTLGYFDRWCQILDSGEAPELDMDPDYPGRVRFDPPGEEDMSLYDTSAILAAWDAGDPSGLSGEDRETYDAAAEILAEIMQDGMSDLEKETAAYHWIVENVDYDWSHQDVLAETDRRSYEPYGGLVNRKAVCLGYATSFQLLMDMSGVECITVVGADTNATGDHAWNMVRLNGEWYCVDPTWDANSRELIDKHEWRNFNLTSDEMAKNHQWDYANTPEATAEDRGGAA